MAERQGLKLRELRDARTGRVLGHVLEVEFAGELERIRDRLSEREYGAGIALRDLWGAGALNPGASSTATARLCDPCFGWNEISDERLELNDDLRQALRSIGEYGRYAIEVCCYDCRVSTADELAWMREALSKLADHLSAERAA